MTTSPIADIPKSYECPNIVEIAKICGYNTLWISNQSKKGLYDNKVTLFAQLCDSAVFNGHEISLDKRDYDIGVVNHIKSSQKCHNTNRFLFVHLMGSHQKFNQRYPNSFAKFSSAEYSKYPKNQRDNLAAYDNTVLYNDYVMSEIIKCFSNDDAVLLYFSDHAIDVYKTDPNFCGHAMPGNKKSEQVSKLIPFMIYTSPKFRENHKDLTSMIEQSVDINFNTTDLPYMVMQLLGVTFSDRENKSPLIATY
jgi:glucan phosphoethanolaminetransferase (alkaline phosphatase superfamily)